MMPRPFFPHEKVNLDEPVDSTLMTFQSSL
jgi:hypothetical protein